MIIKNNDEFSKKYGIQIEISTEEIEGGVKALIMTFESKREDTDLKYKAEIFRIPASKATTEDIDYFQNLYNKAFEELKKLVP